jgi:hypothetical protein
MEENTSCEQCSQNTRVHAYLISEKTDFKTEWMLVDTKRNIYNYKWLNSPGSYTKYEHI